MGRKPAKSETLTIRLDPKTRFMLEFMSRLRGQTITTVVERAITDAAGRATIAKEFDYAGNLKAVVSWRDFWSVVEGERALKMAAETEVHPTFDEERRLAFARTHWPFFFLAKDSETIRTGYVEVLWPRIDEFIELFESTKTTNYFQAGEAMAKALTDARVAPPDNWPPKRKRFDDPPAKDNVDDELPF